MHDHRIGLFMPDLALARFDGEEIRIPELEFFGSEVIFLINFWDRIDDLGGIAPDISIEDSSFFLCIINKFAFKIESPYKIISFADRMSKFSQIFSIDGPFVITTNRRQQITGIFTADQDGFNQAIKSAVLFIKSRAPDSVDAPVLLINNIIDETFSNKLLDYWKNQSKIDSATSGSLGNMKINKLVKKRLDVPVKDANLYGQIIARISLIVIPEIEKVFLKKIQYIELPRIGCYDSRELGQFGRHRDNRTKFTKHRLFALSINLNQPNYVGGEISFPEYGSKKYSPNPLGGIIFSCNLLHEVLPVTAGKRFGLFTFLHDEAGEEYINNIRTTDPGFIKVDNN